MKFIVLNLLVIYFLTTTSLFADECDFDQNSRIAENVQLQKKYPKSRLSDDKLILRVPSKEGEVSINIGGCTHYGVNIELKTPKTDKYNNENAFMNKVLSLVKTYSQGSIEYENLKAVITDKDWLKLQKDGFYFINYGELSTFEAYRNTDNKYTIIGINYYH